MKYRHLLFAVLLNCLTFGTGAQIMQLHSDPEFDEYRIRKHLFIRGFSTDTIESMVNSFKYQYFQNMQAMKMMAPPPDGVASTGTCNCYDPSCWLDAYSGTHIEYDSANIALLTGYPVVKNRGNFFDNATTGYQGWYARLSDAYNMTSATWTYDPWYTLSSLIGPTAYRYKLNTDPDETDPFTLEKMIPKKSTRSVTVGNADMGIKGQRMATKFIVDHSTDTSFDIRYSVVLYDPPTGHSDVSTRPAFSIRVFVKRPDQNYYYEDCCAKYEIFSSPNIPGFKRAVTDSSIVYKPWSVKSIDLQRYEDGSGVIIEVSTHHCAWGPHFSYAYVDGNVNSQQQITKKGQLCMGTPVSFSSDAFGTFKKEQITWSLLKAGSVTPEESVYNITYPAYTTIDDLLKGSNTTIKNALTFKRTFTPAPEDLPVTYTLTLKIENDDPAAPDCPPILLSRKLVVEDCQPIKVECEDCIPSFSPIPGKKYMVSAWVKQQKTTFQSTYTGPEIWIRFNGVNKTAGPFKASGAIIDGWQKVEAEFIVAEETTSLEVELKNSSADDVLFDDIRIYPFDGALRSFVYNPKDFKLKAELDENNYATFYDYDEQGDLVRVKKETVKGVQTVKEIFTNTHKKP